MNDITAIFLFILSIGLIFYLAFIILSSMNMSIYKYCEEHNFSNDGFTYNTSGIYWITLGDEQKIDCEVYSPNYTIEG
jgi:hypothetical protein